MWGWAVIAILAAVMTSGISWLVFPFFANSQHRKSLLKNGYFNSTQMKRTNDAAERLENANFGTHGIADEILKLANLKEKGLITDNEFVLQKGKLM